MNTERSGRNKTLSLRGRPITAALGAVTFLLLTGWYLFHHWRAMQAEQRADVFLAAIRDPDAFQRDYMAREIEQNRNALMPRLLGLLDDPSATENERLRVRAILAPHDPSQVAPLMQALQTTNIDNVVRIREALTPYREQVIPVLWQRLEKATALPGERLRAAAVLATYQPADPRWERLSEAIVAILAAQDALDFGDWLQALRPIRERLVAPLARLFRNRDNPAHLLAADALSIYAAERTPLLVDLLLDATSQQFFRLWPAVASRPQPAIERLEREFSELPPANAVDRERELLAGRKAQAVVALLLLDRPGYVWPQLRRTEDMRLRTWLIHRLADLGVEPRILIRQFQEATDSPERRALLLSLGTMPPDLLADGERKAFLDNILSIFRDSPDPGLHAASKWLLRRWGYAAAVDEAEKKLAVRRAITATSARWYVNTEGLTLVIVPGPVEFWMGSPTDEPDRRSNEVLHRRRIGRSFAIAANPVTVEQFQRFLTANPTIVHEHEKPYSPQSTSPANSITWLNAVRYCRWLSEQEQVPEDEMCYPPMKEIKEGMRLPGNFLDRTGYRLPTEAEWEFACRAGSTTSRFYGSGEKMLGNYACFVGNSSNRTCPVGTLKPNDLGLFDMHGNVWNWCQDVYAAYPKGTMEQPAEHAFDAAPVALTQYRVLRGGAFDCSLALIRSAYRNWDDAGSTDSNVGLRIARTWR